MVNRGRVVSDAKKDDDHDDDDVVDSFVNGSCDY